MLKDEATEQKENDDITLKKNCGFLFLNFCVTVYEI